MASGSHSISSFLQPLPELHLAVLLTDKECHGLLQMAVRRPPPEFMGCPDVAVSVAWEEPL